MCCRRERGDGDQVPLFAPLEGESPGIERRGEDREACFVRTPSPEGDALDATTLDAATDLLEGLIEDMSATEASDLMQGDESADEDLGENKEHISTRVGEARPPSSYEVCEVQKQSPHAGPLFGSNLDFRERKAFRSTYRLVMLKERLLNPEICRSLEQRRTSLENLHTSSRQLIGL